MSGPGKATVVQAAAPAPCLPNQRRSVRTSYQEHAEEVPNDSDGSQIDGDEPTPHGEHLDKPCHTQRGRKRPHQVTKTSSTHRNLALLKRPNPGARHRRMVGRSVPSSAPGPLCRPSRCRPNTPDQLRAALDDDARTPRERSCAHPSPPVSCICLFDSLSLLLVRSWLVVKDPDD